VSGFSRSSPPRLRPGFTTTTSIHTTRTEEDDSSTEEKGENILLKQLGENFRYEGRLPAKENFRCGFVSILGAPNMGKSTLLNALLQEDLCIATSRPQTTRHAILGVLTTAECQLCLIDTPGIIDNPAYKLQEGMMEAVMGAFHDSEVLLVVTDLFSTPIPDDEIFAKVQRSRKPTIVVVNKIDLVSKVNPNAEENQAEGRTTTVEEAIAKWRTLLPNAMAILPVAASQGAKSEGVTVLRKLLLGEEGISGAIRNLGRPISGMFQQDVQFLSEAETRSLLPNSPPLYDEEILTDRTERYVLDIKVDLSMLCHSPLHIQSSIGALNHTTGSLLRN
jgi:small GTP-binding protein